MVEPLSAFREFRFPGEVIIVAVRMYLRYRLTYRDVENDHGPPKTWLRPMRGLKRDDCAQRVMPGHALVRNIRNGHYALAPTRR